jgi:hypothetical protein
VTTRCGELILGGLLEPRSVGPASIEPSAAARSGARAAACGSRRVTRPASGRRDGRGGAKRPGAAPSALGGRLAAKHNGYSLCAQPMVPTVPNGSRTVRNRHRSSAKNHRAHRACGPCQSDELPNRSAVGLMWSTTVSPSARRSRNGFASSMSSSRCSPAATTRHSGPLKNLCADALTWTFRWAHDCSIASR